MGLSLQFCANQCSEDRPWGRIIEQKKNKEISRCLQKVKLCLPKAKTTWNIVRTTTDEFILSLRLCCRPLHFGLLFFGLRLKLFCWTFCWFVSVRMQFRWHLCYNLQWFEARMLLILVPQTGHLVCLLHPLRHLGGSSRDQGHLKAQEGRPWGPCVNFCWFWVILGAT